MVAAPFPNCTGGFSRNHLSRPYKIMSVQAELLFYWMSVQVGNRSHKTKVNYEHLPFHPCHLGTTSLSLRTKFSQHALVMTP